jgi:arylsulfatase A-like enzyme
MNPNIIFLTIDSLRADKTFGKNKSSITPNIDKLISTGTCFNQAISTADQTGLSLGSVFTSLYPFRSGISYFNFDHSVPNFFNIMKTEGYELNSFVPDLSFFKNLSKNFDKNNYYVYDERNEWLQLIGYGKEIIKKIKNMTNPWFYFIHLMDLRPPYSIPPEFNKEEFGETEYDRMLSYIDSWIGEFLEKIDLDETVFVLTADHGEYISILETNLNEVKLPKIFRKTKKIIPTNISDKILSSLQKHKHSTELKKRKEKMLPEDFRTLQNRCDSFLFDELLKIPLILTGFNIPSNLIIHQQVRQVDIFPTLSELGNFSTTIEKINGKSLVPLLHNKIFDEEPAYIETGSSNSKVLGKLIGIRTSNYKYLRSRDQKTQNVILYDLKNDENETENIALSNPETIKKMEKILQVIRKNSNIDDSVIIPDEQSKEIEEELKKLGYI